MPNHRKLVNGICAFVIIAGLFSAYLGASGVAGRLFLPREQLLPNEFTFGNTDISDSTDSGYGQINLWSFQCPSSGTLTALNLYCQQNTGSPRESAVVYSDNAGTPGSLLGVGVSTPAPSSWSWLQLTGLNIPVSTGVTYWLGVWISGSTYGDIINYSRTDVSYPAGPYLYWQYNSAPAVFGTPNGWDTWIGSIYASATPTSTPTPTPTPTITPTSQPTPTPSPTPMPTATPIPQVSLTIDANTGGTTNPSPGIYNYNMGTQITITASQNSGYTFTYWLMNDYSKIYSLSTTLTMTTSRSALAVFTAIPQPTPTPAPGATPAPTPAPTPEPTPLPVATPQPTITPTPTASSSPTGTSPNSINEFFSVFGLASAFIGGIVAVWYNLTFTASKKH